MCCPEFLGGILNGRSILSFHSDRRVIQPINLIYKAIEYICRGTIIGVCQSCSLEDKGKSKAIGLHIFPRIFQNSQLNKSFI